MKDCRYCKHFFVCAYAKKWQYQLDDMLQYLNIHYNSNSPKTNRAIYRFMAKHCEHFDKDCYSKEMKTTIKVSQSFKKKIIKKKGSASIIRREKTTRKTIRR